MKWNSRKSLLVICIMSLANCELEDNFCQGQDLTSSCSISNQVMIVKESLYGRTNSGCAITDFGYTECASNEIDKLHQYCSGKPACDTITVNDGNMPPLKCHTPPDLARTLRLKYQCITVYNPSAIDSVSNVLEPLTLTFKKDSNNDQVDTCGTPENPYLIKAEHGQKINVSITTFAYNAEECFQSKIRFGYIIEAFNGSEITKDVIAPCHAPQVHKGMSHVYVSQSNSIRFVVLKPDMFLLTLQVINPADVECLEAGSIANETAISKQCLINLAALYGQALNMCIDKNIVSSGVFDVRAIFVSGVIAATIIVFCILFALCICCRQFDWFGHRDFGDDNGTNKESEKYLPVSCEIDKDQQKLSISDISCDVESPESIHCLKDQDCSPIEPRSEKSHILLHADLSHSNKLNQDKNCRKVPPVPPNKPLMPHSDKTSSHPKNYVLKSILETKADALNQNENKDLKKPNPASTSAHGKESNEDIVHG